MSFQHSISELEEKLRFKFLPAIAFESPEDKEDIKTRGLNAQVSIEAEELGKRYAPQILAAYIPAVSVRFIDENVGYGLFAEEPISAGSYVGEYTGIVRRNDRRHFEPLNNYCYEYPVPDSIGRSHVIDATAGNLTRFINHSYTPNLQSTHVFLDGFYHLIFLALHPIQKDTQLTFNYGKNYWYIRSSPQKIP